MITRILTTCMITPKVIKDYLFHEDIILTDNFKIVTLCAPGSLISA